MRNKNAWDRGYTYYGYDLRDAVSYAKAYAERRGVLHELVLKEYFRKMKIVSSMIHERLKKDSSILEVGCGGGYYLEYIHQGYNNTFLVGIDISMRAIKERRINGAKLSNIEFIEADAKQLPFRDDVFDCVYSSETLEHIPHVGKFFSEAFRIMKRGLMVALTPNGERINPFLALVVPILLFKKAKEKSIITEINPRESPEPYDRALSRAELEYLCISKGFHNVNVEPIFHFPSHPSFPEKFKFSRLIYNLFLFMEPIFKTLLKRYGRLLILSAEKLG